jgi:protein-tyrosine phosphatase
MSTVHQTSRSLYLEGGVNFRDLGGYRNNQGRTVKWRKLMRSGHLAELTTGDLDTLQALGVEQIHDFRCKEEQYRHPSRAVRSIRTTNITDDYQIATGDIGQFWESLRKNQLNASLSHELVVRSYSSCIDYIAPAFSRFMKHIIAQKDGATLFHCTAGKDRTGMAAALILSALDIPRSTIVEDYMLSIDYFDNSPLVEIVEVHLRDNDETKWERSWIMPYCSVHQDNITAFFNSIDERYGNMHNYFAEALKLSNGDLEKMQDKFLCHQ